MTKLDGKRVAFLAAEGVEQVELTDPWRAVKDAGGELITSRNPDDLPAFREALVEQVARTGAVA